MDETPQKFRSTKLFLATVRADRELHKIAGALQEAGLEGVSEPFDVLRQWLAERREQIQDAAYENLEGANDRGAKAG